ncbi:PREDICTED: SLAM family member 7 isoform X2 [Corvus brachyrhynchos]|uniref:SLAM family member 7 isoform X2 n=1 Tax=Corvus brachyrhynchos TaxID=85066 RepID=UPI00081661BE|nr:PREDICTED: SLAM family member 7 isoform X2 [Corvus brachyrhynchos]
MSMDSFQLQFLALLMLLHTAMCADGTREVIGAVGTSITFPIQPPAGSAVFWTFGNDPIATVLPKDPPEVLFSEEKYEKRFTFPENGRALSISQLSLEDAGIYSVKIDGKTSTFTLRVYGELAEPTVTCEDRNCSAGSCRFSLRCSVPGTGLGNISYLWSKGEQPWDEGPTVLVVNESSWNEPESLTCTARNPVSSRNVTVVAPGGLCEDAHSGARTGIGVGASLGIVSLSVALFVLLCKFNGWRKSHLSKEKRMNTVSTVDDMTMYAEVGPSQQRIPNGTKAKPTEAPESSSTIYSLVKHPGQAGNGKEENATASLLELV